MNNQRAMRRVLAALAVLAGCGLVVFVRAAPTPFKEPAKPPSPQAVKAWRAAGARIGCMKDSPPWTDGYGECVPYRDKVEPGALPAFRYHPKQKGDLARLPDPGTPFGLDTHCCSMSDADLKELARLKNLQSLNLGGALLLSDAGLKELMGLKNLQALYLFWSPVTDAGMKTLAGMPKLRVLDLYQTRVKDAGLKELTRLKNLQALNVGSTGVTDAGLKELAGLKSLQWLNLDGSKVTAKGVDALQKKLPKCTILFADN